MTMACATMSPYRSLKVLDHHRHVFNIVFQTQKRWLHYSLARQAVTTTASSSSSPPNVPAPPISDILTRKQPVKPPLSLLPFTSLVRSYLIASISSSPALLSLCLRLFSTLARSPSPILNPDRNPILRYLVKKTFYAQYCAGETSNEVERTISDLRKVGYEGVILAYAREFDVSAGQLGTAETKNATEANGEIEAWKKGTLETVSLASKGDFVALKYACSSLEDCSTSMLTSCSGLLVQVVKHCIFSLASCHPTRRSSRQPQRYVSLPRLEVFLSCSTLSSSPSSMASMLGRLNFRRGTTVTLQVTLLCTEHTKHICALSRQHSRDISRLQKTKVSH